MSDEQRLLAVIVVIYLADCIYWISRSGISVSKWFRAEWKLRTPGLLLGNDRGAFALANPLPPLGLVTRALPCPISFSAHGLLSCTSAAFNEGGRSIRSAKLVAWNDLQKIEHDGRKIFLNEELFYTAVSSYSARHLAEIISILWKTSAQNRESKIRELLADTFNSNEVKKSISNFSTTTRSLQFFCNILFAFLFVAAPLLVWRFGLAAVIWYLVAVLLLQTLTIALLFRRAHRVIYPQDDSEIFKPFLTMLLAPPSAIRAREILCRPLLERFHPVAVLNALASDETFKSFAAKVCRDLHYPRLPILPANTTEEAQRTEAVFRTASIEEFDHWLRKENIPTDDFLRPPSPSEPLNLSHCPRCLQQFTSLQGQCLDCGGIPLQPLRPAKEQPV